MQFYHLGTMFPLYPVHRNSFVIITTYHSMHMQLPLLPEVCSYFLWIQVMFAVINFYIYYPFFQTRRCSVLSRLLCQIQFPFQAAMPIFCFHHQGSKHSISLYCLFSEKQPFNLSAHSFQAAMSIRGAKAVSLFLIFSLHMLLIPWKSKQYKQQ